MLVLWSLKVLSITSPGTDCAIGAGLLLVFMLWSGQGRNLLAFFFAPK
ncbi:hypothetical protein [Paracidobacterium acidisoli]|nr:hypothetical protein [Paracidobacterium acidisoli]MBT9331271.1 hypothetical protein [Paracidobacterium acidisoli]